MDAPATHTPLTPNQVFLASAMLEERIAIQEVMKVSGDWELCKMGMHLSIAHDIAVAALEMQLERLDAQLVRMGVQP